MSKIFLGKSITAFRRDLDDIATDPNATGSYSELAAMREGTIDALIKGMLALGGKLSVTQRQIIYVRIFRLPAGEGVAGADLMHPSGQSPAWEVIESGDQVFYLVEDGHLADSSRALQEYLTSIGSDAWSGRHLEDYLVYSAIGLTEEAYLLGAPEGIVVENRVAGVESHGTLYLERDLHDNPHAFGHDTRHYSVRTNLFDSDWVDSDTLEEVCAPEVSQSHRIKLLAWVATGRPSVEELKTVAREEWRKTFLTQRRLREQQARAAEEREAAARREESRARLRTFLSTPPDPDGPEVIAQLPFLPHGLASSRRWGIEIESGGARGVHAPSGWTRKYDGSLRSAWDGYKEVQDFEPFDEEVQETVSWSECANSLRHNPLVHVRVEGTGEFVPAIREDFLAAVDCDDCGQVTRTVRREPRTIVHSSRSDDCAEFVSPILVSAHSNGLEEVLEQIAKQPQNDTAGVHVHVEANDLTAREVATLVYGYGMIERLITSSYRRERRDYCQAISPDEVVISAERAKNPELGISYGDRYRSVNLHALSAHGTVEFRSMGPVYDYGHLIRWAMFCREMVNVVKAGATVSDFSRATSFDKVTALFARFGKEYIRAAAYELTGETGSWARLTKGNPRGSGVTVAAVQAALDEDYATWLAAQRGNVNVPAACELAPASSLTQHV